MPPFALNADVYSPIRLKAFAEQTQQFALSVAGRLRCRRSGELHGQDGRAAVEVVEAGSRSSDSGEAVHLPIDPA